MEVEIENGLSQESLQYATALVTTGCTREILSQDRSLQKGEVENTEWELEVDHEAALEKTLLETCGVWRGSFQRGSSP